MDEVDSFADLDLSDEDIDDVTPAGDCTTQSHKSQKVVIQDGTLYLQGPRAGQARLEPALKIDTLPVDISVEELLLMHKPYDVMIAYFSSIAADLQDRKPSAVTSSGASSPGSWTPVDL
eukprot:scaffold163352_cov87-Attheya_sp.AAC.1